MSFLLPRILALEGNAHAHRQREQRFSRSTNPWPPREHVVVRRLDRVEHRLAATPEEANIGAHGALDPLFERAAAQKPRPRPFDLEAHQTAEGRCNTPRLHVIEPAGEGT